MSNFHPLDILKTHKIHGCSTKPASLVLTTNDYEKFNDQNAYLAAKLITLFVEHPVVFIGYSLSDENITSLLRAISLCIGKDHIEQLRKNLIFVQRHNETESGGVSDTYLTIDGVQIPLVLAKTNDLRPVYQALAEVKRKIPARVLRYCKEQLYALVASSEPEKKLCVLDFDDIDKNEEIEFLVGVGVANKSTIGDIGYAAIDGSDLIHDLLHDDRGYSPKQIAENVVKRAGQNSKNIPVFKYLRGMGINNQSEYAKANLGLDRWVNRDLKDFRVKTYVTGLFKRRHLSMEQLLEACTAENAAGYIPCMSADKIDLALLHEFLVKHEDKMDYKNPYASNFRKLAALYDRLKWGW